MRLKSANCRCIARRRRPLQLAPDDALGWIKHHGGVDREVSAGIAVLPLQEFYTGTAAYMREVDPARLDDGLAHAMDAERVGLEAELGPSRQRWVLDCSCGSGTQAIRLAELGWQVTATDVTQTSLDAARAMATRRNVAVDWRVSDLGAVGSLFCGQFEWVISCMALNNIL